MSLLNLSSLRGLFTSSLKKTSTKKSVREKLNRKLAVDSLEDRVLLSVTPMTTYDVVVNTAYSENQSTSSNGNSVAVDSDGDFVVAWSRTDNIYKDSNGNVGELDINGNVTRFYTDEDYINNPYDEDTNKSGLKLYKTDDNVYGRYFTDEEQRITLDTSDLAPDCILEESLINITNSNGEEICGKDGEIDTSVEVTDTLDVNYDLTLTFENDSRDRVHTATFQIKYLDKTYSGTIDFEKGVDNLGTIEDKLEDVFNGFNTEDKEWVGVNITASYESTSGDNTIYKYETTLTVDTTKILDHIKTGSGAWNLEPLTTLDCSTKEIDIDQDLLYSFKVKTGEWYKQTITFGRGDMVTTLIQSRYNLTYLNGTKTTSFYYDETASAIDNAAELQTALESIFGEGCVKVSVDNLYQYTIAFKTDNLTGTAEDFNQLITCTASVASEGLVQYENSVYRFSLTASGQRKYTRGQALTEGDLDFSYQIDRDTIDSIKYAQYKDALMNGEVVAVEASAATESTSPYYGRTEWISAPQEIDVFVQYEFELDSNGDKKKNTQTGRYELAKDENGKYIIDMATTAQNLRDSFFDNYENMSAVYEGKVFFDGQPADSIEFLDSEKPEYYLDYEVWCTPVVGLDGQLAFDITYVNSSGKTDVEEIIFEGAKLVSNEDDFLTWPEGLTDEDYSEYTGEVSVATLKQNSEEFRINSLSDDVFNPKSKVLMETTQDDVSVAMDADGDFVATWTGGRSQSLVQGTVTDIYARMFHAEMYSQYNKATNSYEVLNDGKCYTAENAFRVNTSTANPSNSSAVAMDDEGNFVVVWVSEAQEQSYCNGISLQRYNFDCKKLGEEIRVDEEQTRVAVSPNVAIQPNGEVIGVTWTWTHGFNSIYNQNVQDNEIMLQFYRTDSDVNSITQIRSITIEGNNTVTPGADTHTSIDINQAGDVYYTWSGEEDGSIANYVNQYQIISYMEATDSTDKEGGTWSYNEETSMWEYSGDEDKSAGEWEWNSNTGEWEYTGNSNNLIWNKCIKVEDIQTNTRVNSAQTSDSDATGTNLWTGGVNSNVVVDGDGDFLVSYDGRGLDAYTNFNPNDILNYLSEYINDSTNSDLLQYFNPENEVFIPVAGYEVTGNDMYATQYMWIHNGNIYYFNGNPDSFVQMVLSLAQNGVTQNGETIYYYKDWEKSDGSLVVTENGNQQLIDVQNAQRDSYYGIVKNVWKISAEDNLVLDTAATQGDQKQGRTELSGKITDKDGKQLYGYKDDNGNWCLDDFGNLIIARETDAEYAKKVALVDVKDASGNYYYGVQINIWERDSKGNVKLVGSTVENASAIDAVRDEYGNIQYGNWETVKQASKTDRKYSESISDYEPVLVEGNDDEKFVLYGYKSGNSWKIVDNALVVASEVDPQYDTRRMIIGDQLKYFYGKRLANGTWERDEKGNIKLYDTADEAEGIVSLASYGKPYDSVYECVVVRDGVTYDNETEYLTNEDGCLIEPDETTDTYSYNDSYSSACTEEQYARLAGILHRFSDLTKGEGNGINFSMFDASYWIKNKDTDTLTKTNDGESGVLYSENIANANRDGTDTKTYISIEYIEREYDIYIPWTSLTLQIVGVPGGVRYDETTGTYTQTTDGARTVTIELGDEDSNYSYFYTEDFQSIADRISNAIQAELSDIWPREDGYEGAVEVRYVTTREARLMDDTEYDINGENDPYPEEWACFEIQFNGALHDCDVSVVTEAATYNPITIYDIDMGDFAKAKLQGKDTGDSCQITVTVGTTTNTYIYCNAIDSVNDLRNAIITSMGSSGVTIGNTDYSIEIVKNEDRDDVIRLVINNADVSIGITSAKPPITGETDPYPSWKGLKGYSISSYNPLKPSLDYIETYEIFPGDSGTTQCYSSVDMTPEGDYTFVWTEAGDSTTIRARTFKEEDDTFGPQVVSLYYSDGTQVAKNGTIFDMGTENSSTVKQGLVLTFTEELMDYQKITASNTTSTLSENRVNSVTNIDNWTVYRDGIKQEGIIECIYYGMNASSDPYIQNNTNVKALQQNKWEAVIVFADGVELESGNYEIKLSKDIHDANNVPLNADGNNTKGYDTTLTFEIISDVKDVEVVAVDDENLEYNNTLVDLDGELWSPKSSATDTEGDSVIVWTSEEKGIQAQITYRKWEDYSSGSEDVDREYDDQNLTADESLWTKEINVTTNKTAKFASVDMAGNGDFVVTWSQYDGKEEGWNVYARMFDLNGKAKGDAFRVNATIERDQCYSSVACSLEGDFVVTWQGKSQKTGWDIYAQRYDMDGTSLGRVDEIQILSFTSNFNGSFKFKFDGVEADEEVQINVVNDEAKIVDKEDDNKEDDNKNDVKTILQEALNKFATKLKEQKGIDYEFSVVRYTNTSYKITIKTPSDVSPDVDLLDYVPVTIPEGQQINTVEEYQQGKYGEFMVNQTKDNDQKYASIDMDYSGDFVITWTSTSAESGTNQEDIYARKFTSSTELTDVLSGKSTIYTSTQYVIRANNATDQTSKFSGVASIEADGNLGSGFLLKDGGSIYVVTAAHVLLDESGDKVDAEDVSVTFYDTEGNKTSAYKATTLYVHPDYDGTYADVALIKLETSLTGIVESYSFCRDEDIGEGKTYTRYGYGLNGEGTVGGESSDGKLRTGKNEWEYLETSADGTMGLLYYDFDDGSNKCNTLQQYFDLNEIDKTSSKGLGLDETAAAHGDSGGPCFLNIGTDYLVVAICHGGISINSDETIAEEIVQYSQYGLIGLDTPLAFYADWIDKYTGGEEDIVVGSFGGEFKVNTYTSGIQKWSDVAMDADGDFVITWTSQYEGTPQSGNIYARCYSSSTTPVTDKEFRVNSTIECEQQLSKVAMDADGDFVITWESYQEFGDGVQKGSPNNYGIYAQRYDADSLMGEAVTVGSEFCVNEDGTKEHISGNQRVPNVCMTAAGDMYFVWQSDEKEIQGVYSREYKEVTDDAGPVVVSVTSSSVELNNTELVGKLVVNDGDKKEIETIYVKILHKNSITLEGAKDLKDGYYYVQCTDNTYTVQKELLKKNENSQFEVVPVADYNKLNPISVLIRDGSEVEGTIHDGLIFTFDEQLIGQEKDEDNHTSITNINNWTIYKDGQNVTNLYVKSIELADDDANIGYNNIDTSYTYNTEDPDEGNLSQKNKYKLVLKKDLDEGSYTIKISDSVLDRMGNQLDGNYDGDAGDKYSISFDVVSVSTQGYGKKEENETNATSETTNDFVNKIRTSLDQYESAVAMNEYGDYVVVWVSQVPADLDSSTSGSDAGEWVQDESGKWVYQGEDGTIISTDTPATNTVIYGQRFTRGGTPLDDPFEVSKGITGVFSDPDVAMDDFGNFVVTWTCTGQDWDGDGKVDEGEAKTSDVYVMMYGNDGNPISNTTTYEDVIPFQVEKGITYNSDNSQVKASETTSGLQYAAAVAYSNGKIVVTWTNIDYNKLTWNSADQNGIYCMVYDLNGECILTDPVLVNDPTTYTECDSSVAADGNGNFVVVWDAAGSGEDIYSRKFELKDTTLTSSSVMVVNEELTRGDQRNADVAMDNLGNYVVTWQSQVGSITEIHYKGFKSDGTAIFEEKRANEDTYSNKANPSISIQKGIGIPGTELEQEFVIAWQSYGQENISTKSWGVYLNTFYLANGESILADGKEILVNAYRAEDEYDVDVAMDYFGEYTAVWTGPDSANQSLDIALSEQERLSYSQNTNIYNSIFYGFRGETLKGYEEGCLKSSSGIGNSATTSYASTFSTTYSATTEKQALTNGGATISVNGTETIIKAKASLANSMYFDASKSTPTVTLNDVVLDVSTSNYVFDAQGSSSTVSITGRGGETVSFENGTVIITGDGYTLKVLNASNVRITSSDVNVNVTASDDDSLSVSGDYVACSSNSVNCQITGCVSLTALGTGKAVAKLSGTEEDDEFQVTASAVTLNGSKMVLDVQNFGEVYLYNMNTSNVTFKEAGSFSLEKYTVAYASANMTVNVSNFLNVKALNATSVTASAAGNSAYSFVENTLTVKGEFYDYSFAGVASVNLDGTETDTLNLQAAQNVLVNGSSFQIGSSTFDGFGSATITNVKELSITGTEGDDQFTVSENVEFKAEDFTYTFCDFSSLVVSASEGKDSAIVNAVTKTDKVTFLKGVAKVNENVTIQGISSMAYIGGENGTAEVQITGSNSDDSFTLAENSVSANIAGAVFTATGASNVTIDGNGGSDSISVSDTDGNDSFIVAPGSLTLEGGNCVWNVSNVQNIKLNSTNGGNDSLIMNGSSEDDRLILSPKQAMMSNSSSTVSALGFAAITVNGGYGDVAVLYDSIGNDTAVVENGKVTLSGSAFYNQVSGFTKVNLYAINGGEDTIQNKTGIASATDEIFSVSDEDWTVKGTGFTF